MFVVTQPGALPSSLTATATSPSSVLLVWISNATVDHFEVWRDSGPGFVLLSSPRSTSYTDTMVSANKAYMYKVRAVDSDSNASDYTNSDSAITIMFTFTDDPLIPGSTPIKAVHVLQLREAVNSMRSAAGMEAVLFTDLSLAGVPIKLIHIIELRNALDPARAALHLPAMHYTSISIGSMVGAAELMELRNAVR